jgi:uncharacterized coiled-coil protein SlyX
MAKSKFTPTEYTLGSIADGVHADLRKEVASEHRHLATPELEFRLSLRYHRIQKLEDAGRRAHEELEHAKTQVRLVAEKLAKANTEYEALKAIIAARG